jgi:DNA-binding NarL/FixJ family response regulator
MIRVLIADDQALVRAGFHAILESEGDIEVAGEAADGQEAVELTRKVRPDVVLMDIRMPGLDGIEATRRLLRDDDAPKVLMLTTFDLDEYLYEAMRAGASGFLLKDVPREQLINAVRTVSEGDALVAPALVRRLVEDFLRRPPPGTQVPPQVQELSKRELEVLTLVARGLSNAEIAETLFLSEATVRTHVAHILSKLRLRDRVQAVVLAYESGLVTPGDLTRTVAQRPGTTSNTSQPS